MLSRILKYVSLIGGILSEVTAFPLFLAHTGRCEPTKNEQGERNETR